MIKGLKIFGVGLNKTGTKTLGACMQTLGFRNKSFDLDLLIDYSSGRFDNIDKIVENHDSFEDWPWPLMVKKFDMEHPEAKFILTLRKDPETWFSSLCKHAELTGPTQARKIVYGYEMPHGHKNEHIEYYLNHQQEIVNYFKNRENKLLIVSWERGDGWIELCKFLGQISIPSLSFPHKNKSYTTNHIDTD